MLEDLNQQRLGGTLCRFANVRRRLDALRALGLASDDVNEVLVFLGGDGDPVELLDAPLRADPSYTPEPTRFSDGSWRVFYAARDWRTAVAEVGHHVRAAGHGAVSPLYYQRLECTLAGTGYDLCPQRDVWPFLIDPHEANAYPPCQAVAREARGHGADGLATFSARIAEGMNVPVFERPAVSDPHIVGSAAIFAGPGTYRVELG